MWTPCSVFESLFGLCGRPYCPGFCTIFGGTKWYKRGKKWYKPLQTPSLDPG
nr:MAG TPA: hypothetical protein [Caudoviricetes sp.]